MKKGIVLLLISKWILWTANPAFAESSGGAAGAILISFAAAKGVATIGISALEQLELEEWKDQRARSTAILGDSCGFYYEARLIGDARANYLWLTLKNNNSSQRSFNPIEVEFKFSSGVERRPDLFRFNEIFFEPGRLYNMILPFPAKEDFKKQHSLEVLVPFSGEGKRCDIPIKMERNLQVADTLKSTASLNILETELVHGPTAYSGKLSKIFGSSGNSSSLNMMIYGPSNGGFYMGFRIFNSTKIPNEIAATEGYTDSRKAFLSEFYLGYAHRFLLNQDSMIVLKGGLGGTTLNVVREDSNDRDYFSASMIDVEAGYQNIFKRVKSGVWKGNYYWGVNLSNSFIRPSRPITNGTSFSGSATSAVLLIGVGL